MRGKRLAERRVERRKRKVESKRELQVGGVVGGDPVPFGEREDVAQRPVLRQRLRVDRQTPQERQEFVLLRRGQRDALAWAAAQDVDAALAKSWTNPVDARARATALGKMPKEARAVFKRIANILDDAATKKIVPSRAVDPAKFASVVEPLVGHEVPVPPVLAALLARPARNTPMAATPAALASALAAAHD